MAEARQRRIIRRAVMAVAGVVLALMGYVESFRLFWWCEGHGNADPWATATCQMCFAPLHLYSETRVLPGAAWLRSEMVTQLEAGRAAARKELAD